MRIGIMTFWESQENYGQIAQALALQIFLKKHGHDPFLIKYEKTATVKKSKKKNFKTFWNRNWASMLDPMVLYKKVIAISKQYTPQTSRQFEEFKTNFLEFHDKTYQDADELKEHPPEADVYLTGSDQVWNYLYTVDPQPYFLQFGSPNAKRASFAASFGHRKLPLPIEKKYEEYLRLFDAISVREKSGIDLCKNMGYLDVTLLPDPTLLVDRETWLQYSNTAPGFEKGATNKIFIYTIGNRSSTFQEKLLKHLKQESKNADSSMVHVSINKDYEGQNCPTIPEWIDHFHQADLVVTNSYHGVLFSIIFNNNFIAIPSAGEKAGMNERMYTILEKVGLEDRLVAQFDKEQLDKIIQSKPDWEEVNQKIADWKLESDRFIERLTSS